MDDRKKNRKISVGDIAIGGGAPVTIQSMINTPGTDTDACIRQIRELQTAGCEIVRMAVPDSKTLENFAEIKKQIRIPLVADIHFDHRLALGALDAGADKIRINPGNIGSKKHIRAVLSACRSYGVPIRIGVNGGSLEKDLLEKYGHPVAEALVKSAERHIRICEEQDFTDVVVSIKSSQVMTMIEANRRFSDRFDNPLHLGVTESGTRSSGSIRSAVGIGTLLAEGIGDTIRVSLSADPVQEISVARRILQSLGLRRDGVRVISCPTCGRCSYNVTAVAEEVEKRVADIRKEVTVAIMGCVVNGPGEAKEADIGIAGAGPDTVVFFEDGNKTGIYPLQGIIDILLERIRKR